MIIDYGKELQKAYDDGYKDRDAEIVRCKDCVHRDPEDKKCDCGSLERQGCPFPVRDDYFCADGEVATVKNGDSKTSGDVK